MIKIALLHTVPSVYQTFEERLRAALPEQEMRVFNVLDEFLVTDAAPSASGHFTLKNKQRLLCQLQAAALTGADLIVTTCSQLSGTAKLIEPLIGVPVVTIDGAMIERAVAAGSRIALISSAQGTVGPVSESILREAERQGKRVTVRVYCDEEAILALKSGDTARHDALLCKLAGTISGCDSALIAQASGAHMGAKLTEIAGLPVFTSIDLCLEEIKRFFEERGTR